MGAVIRLSLNAFDPDREIDFRVSAGITVREALEGTRPELLAQNLTIYRDGEPLELDAVINPHDTIRVAVLPAEPFSFTWYVAYFLISAVVSYAINYFLFPKKKAGKQASPAYSVSVDQNAARIGQPIPVIYGRVRATPDIASQPYAEYVAHNQVVNMILSLGMGEYQVHNIFVGGSRITDFPVGTIRSWLYSPAAHGQRLGPIEAGTGVIEDMNTLLESVGVEVNAPNDSAEVNVSGVISGGTFDPESADAGFWATLQIGTRYRVTNNLGASNVVTFLGVGLNNVAQFSGPLPAVPPPSSSVVRLQAGDVQMSGQGIVFAVYSAPGSGDPATPAWALGEMLSFNVGGLVYGPMQYYADYPNPNRVRLFLTSGPGFVETMPNRGWMQQNVTVTRHARALYTIREETTNSEGNSLRWRGWYTVCGPGTATDLIAIDISMPGGLAWITDGGDYRLEEVILRIEYQQVDDTGNPFGGVTVLTRTFQDQTNNPRRYTVTIPVPVARYRIRLARTNERDQRTSKELSQTSLDGVKARIYHAPNTEAYADCTLLVMSFTASSGLAAAQNRRITVDCTRKLPRLGAGGGMFPTTNPADAIVDAYTATYGAGAPLADLDVPALDRFYNQWATANGFNAIFDQPTTVIDALQTILLPVRAMPVPMGKRITFVQDAPRPRQYMFGPGSIVDGSLTVTYDFDAETDYDFLELTYQDGVNWTDAIVQYPAQGVRPLPMEIFGTTSRTHAESFARLVWQERQFARKQIQFTLEGEGYALEPLTRFGVVIPGVRMGNSGRIINYDAATNSLELDGYFPAARDGLTPRIVLSFYDSGKSSPSLEVFPSFAPTRFVTLVEPLIYGIGESDSMIGDGTQWFATRTADEVYEFRISDLTFQADFKVQVTGVTYDPRTYAGTFLENWTT